MRMAPCVGRSRKVGGLSFVCGFRRPTRSTLFPYTTLFRSEVTAENIAEVVARWTGIPVTRMLESERERLTKRSEEHTSELQSPVHLVCRLLLQQKNADEDRRHPRRACRPTRRARTGQTPRA